MDPWEEISGGDGRLGGGGGGPGGGGIGDVMGGLSCTSVASAALFGRRMGRQGGLRSRRKGMVLLRLQYTASGFVLGTLASAELERE